MSKPASARASGRASERDGVAQGRWSESGTLPRLAAAVGLAPDVKFSCGKAQLYFTFDFGYRPRVPYSSTTTKATTPVRGCGRMRGAMQRPRVVRRIRTREAAEVAADEQSRWLEYS